MRYAKECLDCPEANWTCPLKGKGKGSYSCQGVCMSSAHPNDPCTDRTCQQTGCPYYGHPEEAAA